MGESIEQICEDINLLAWNIEDSTDKEERLGYLAQLKERTNDLEGAINNAQ